MGPQPYQCHKETHSKSRVRGQTPKNPQTSARSPQWERVEAVVEGGLLHLRVRVGFVKISAEVFMVAL